MIRAKAKRFKEALNGLIQEVFTSQGSKFITEDELKLVHMIGMEDANMKESLKHGFQVYGDVACFGDMDGDVASYGDMAFLTHGG